jgi:hypothetical protein
MMLPLKHTGSQFLGGGRLAAPVPVLGAEKITNGNFETWASATDAGTWGESVAGASSVNREGTVVHGGTYAVRLDFDATNNTYVSQASNLANNEWCLVSSWMRTSASGKTMWVALGAVTGKSRDPGTTWTQYFDVLRAAAANPTLVLAKVSAASSSLYFDDVSLKPITLASMFSTRPYTTHATTKAMATIVAGTRAGVVANLDSATSPANFVIASHNGTNAILEKCVAGTYTSLISTSVAYVAGAYVEIRRPAAGNNWQLFYNGSQVGTDQAIADAAIQAATLHGLFQTYSGNTLAAFSCIPSA